MDFHIEDHRIFVPDQNGKIIAEVTFPAVSEDIVNINHTYVDPSLRGQGVADQLLRRAAEKIQSDGKKAVLSCSYAIKWFEKHTEYNGLVVASSR